MKNEIFDTYSGKEAIIGWDKKIDPTDQTRAFGYIYGFKTAADELVDENMPDLLVFPILFDYRQYLELVLKNVYKRNNSNKDFQNFLKKHGHDLNGIFTDTSPFLMTKYNLTQNNVEDIYEVIKDFVKIDKDSFSFRYDYTKNNISTLDSKLNGNGELRIDLAALKSNINFIDNLLGKTYE
jgi:hypothetical protein